MMNKYKKMIKEALIICFCVTASIILTSCSKADRQVLHNVKKEAVKTNSDEPKKDLSKIGQETVIPENKKETVYVTADYNGTPKEIEVSCKLSGIKADKPLADKSDLKDIKNHDGDEDFYELGDENIVWENHGVPINYKGKSDKKLPIGVRVSYFLEGKEINPEDIIGKTGRVKIRFDYTNDTDIPFIFISLVPLPGDVFSNVSVTNGELSSMGNTDMAYGLLVPYLSKLLELNRFDVTKEIKTAEYMEISADAKDFKLDFTATLVSNGLFSDIKDKKLNKILKKSEDIKKLKKSGNKLYDGSSKLSDSLKDFKDYLSKYVNGTEQLEQGFAEFKSGIEYLDKNADNLANGSDELVKGLNGLNDSLAKMDLNKLSKEEAEYFSYIIASVSKLNEGAKKLSQGMAAYNKGVKDINVAGDKLQNSMEELLAAGKQLSNGFDKIKQGGEKLSEGIDKLNKKGLDKIDRTLGAELTDLIENVKNIKALDKKYNNFSGISDGTQGAVSFIIETKEMK